MRLGTKKHDLMQHFDADNLGQVRDAFLQVMDEYAQVYDEVGRKVLHYYSFDALYEDYMSI